MKSKAITLFILISVFSWEGYAAGIRNDIIVQMTVWILTSFLILWIAISRGEFRNIKKGCKKK